MSKKFTVMTDGMVMRGTRIVCNSSIEMQALIPEDKEILTGVLVRKKEGHEDLTEDIVDVLMEELRDVTERQDELREVLLTALDRVPTDTLSALVRDGLVTRIEEPA